MFVMDSSRIGSRPVAGVVRRIATIGLAMGGVALTACKEAAEPAKAAQIVGMNLVDSVSLGYPFTFDVETRDANGKKVTGRRITWSSLNPNIAAVDANGTVTGVAIGGTIITARADDATAQTSLTVQPAVTSVVLAPQSSTVAIGATRPLVVSVTDKDGRTVAGRAVEYLSSSPQVATIDANGVVVGISLGTTTITARVVRESKTGTAQVQVVQVPVATVGISPAGAQTVFDGLTLQLSAVLRDQNNTVLTGRPVSWTTSNQAVATVSSSGLVTGVTLGNVQITAESEGKTASTTVNVVPRPVATVTLGPNPATVKMGTATQLTFELRDANGNQLTTAGRTIIWDSNNKPVATVQDGVVTGVTTGTATVTISVDGKTASAIVTVTP